MLSRELLTVVLNLKGRGAPLSIAAVCAKRPSNVRFNMPRRTCRASPCARCWSLRQASINAKKKTVCGPAVGGFRMKQIWRGSSGIFDPLRIRVLMRLYARKAET
jgi:hypothetical protein